MLLMFFPSSTIILQKALVLGPPQVLPCMCKGICKTAPLCKLFLPEQSGKHETFPQSHKERKYFLSLRPCILRFSLETVDFMAKL